jgi:acylphosphatase
MVEEQAQHSDGTASMTLVATIRGHVQGVGFRAWVRDVASNMKLRGFARNLPDGSVFVVAEGSQSALRTLLRLLHDGPPAAHVSTVDHQWMAQQPNSFSERFEIHH